MGRPGTWKKGQSGNPNGRPKLHTVSEELRKILSGKYKKTNKTKWQMAGEILVTKAIEEKDTTALKLLMQYMDGLPIAKHEITGADGGPLEHHVEFHTYHDDDNKTDAD
uniref:DUF5681 domain-containing protein n=1 Tax=viral metagenome TaxID=1070528 RepID=A0A6M3XYG4_9ZZZZ